MTSTQWQLARRRGGAWRWWSRYAGWAPSGGLDDPAAGPAPLTARAALGDTRRARTLLLAAVAISRSSASRANQ